MSETTDTPPSGGARVLRLRKKDRALSDAHRAHLRGSGLTDESIDAGGFWSERAGRELADILGWRGWPKTRGDGLVIPFFLPDAGAGAEPFFARVRPDQPRVDEKTKKVTKYEQPKDVGVAPYFPVRSRVHRRYTDPSIPLAFTEGEKKAALLDQLGYAAIGATGVSCFHDVSHRADTDEYRLHDLIRKHVAVAGRECFIAFDSDQGDNDNVIRAARVLAGMLIAAGAASVRNVLPTASEAGAKRGIDDFFVDAGENATRALFAAAEPIEGITGNEHADTVVSHRVLEGIPLDPKLRMPHAYSIDRDGSLWHDDGKKNVAVERAAIFIKRLVADLYSGHELVELVFRRDRSWRTVVVPRRVMVDSRALVAEIGQLGAPVDTNSAGAVVRWLRDFEAVNERRLPRSQSVSNCGWHNVSGELVFVMGGEVVRRKESKVELVVERARDRVRLSRALACAGSYDGHLEALQKAWDASPLAAVTIAASLAAPVLMPLDAPLFGLHLAGDSSRGKSSMLKIAASVFGNPRDEEWVASWNSTTVGHEMRASHLSDLPLPIDEAGVVDARERERAVYMIINGTGRSRGAKDGGLREIASWRTVLLSTGEQLLSGADSASGAQARILQFSISGFGTLDAAGVDAVRRGTEENYGHVGREWIEAWLESSLEGRERHRASHRRMVAEFSERAPAGTMNARQAVYWATLAYVESVAHDVLGLGRPGGATIRSLFEEPGDAHVPMRSAATRALDLVRHWIASEPNTFPALVIGSSGSKSAKVEGNPREIHGYIDDDTLYVLPHALRKYLAQSSIDDGVALREWRGAGFLKVMESEGGERFTSLLRVNGSRIRTVALKAEAVGIEAGSGGSGSDDWGG